MRELKKGSLSLLVLHLLRERPSYGYELCEQLRERSGGTLSFEDGAVYPLLHELERQHVVEGYWETTAAGTDGAAADRRGPRRRYYRLTSQGLHALGAALSDWQTFSAAVTRVLEQGGQDLSCVTGWLVTAATGRSRLAQGGI
jgi:PadR family transcriptional regulator PadR